MKELFVMLLKLVVKFVSCELVNTNDEENVLRVVIKYQLKEALSTAIGPMKRDLDVISIKLSLPGMNSRHETDNLIREIYQELVNEKPIFKTLKMKTVRVGYECRKPFVVGGEESSILRGTRWVL